MFKTIFTLLFAKTYAVVATDDGAVFVSKLRTENDFARVGSLLIDEKDRGHRKKHSKAFVRFRTVDGTVFKTKFTEDNDRQRAIDFILMEEERTKFGNAPILLDEVAV